jgi:hypothetical protein
MSTVSSDSASSANTRAASGGSATTVDSRARGISSSCIDRITIASSSSVNVDTAYVSTPRSGDPEMRAAAPAFGPDASRDFSSLDG